MLNRYNELFQQFWDDTFFIMQRATLASIKQGGLLDSSLVDLEKELCQALALKNDCPYVRFHIVQPVRLYLKRILERAAIIRSHSESADLTGNGSKQFLRDDEDSRTLSSAKYSIEALVLIRDFAYQLTWNSSSWIMEFFPESVVQRNDLKALELTTSIIGSGCACEIGAALFASNSHRLREEYRCSDTLPQYLFQLVSRDSADNCTKTATELKRICQAQDVTHITQINGLSRENVRVKRMLNPDSNYVLHFWGTWCKPCLRQHSAIMRVADSLKSQGCTMIHIAYQNAADFENWQKFTFALTSEQLATHGTFDHDVSIIDELAVQRYPSFIVLGKGGRILKRAFSYSELIPFVSTLP